MRTYEELLQAKIGTLGDTLCHFNEKHDSNGRFAKKNGGSSSPSMARTTAVPEGLLSIYGMDARRIPRDAYEYKKSGNVKFIDGARQEIITKMTKSLLSQSANTGYGSNLLSAVNTHTDGYTNKLAMRRALHAELMSAYRSNVTDPDLLPKNSEDEYKLEEMMWAIANKELDEEIDRQGRANAPKEIARQQAIASRRNGKTGAYISAADRINAAYKEASNATNKKPTAMVDTFKGKLSNIVDKVSSTAKSGASSVIDKGNAFLKKAFSKIGG